MARYIRSKEEAAHRLRSRDPAELLGVDLLENRLTDVNLDELVDCLLDRPDVILHLCLGCNQLTDKTGVKLAQYVAASSTITTMSLCGNRFGEKTYLAFAAALRVNTSLQWLDISDNRAIDKNRIDMAFVDALRLNPGRPVGLERDSRRPHGSRWCLYSHKDRLPRLQVIADELGHPSLQLLLCVRLDRTGFQTVQRI